MNRRLRVHELRGFRVQDVGCRNLGLDPFKILALLFNSMLHVHENLKPRLNMMTSSWVLPPLSSSRIISII